MSTARFELVDALRELYEHVWVIQPHDFLDGRDSEAVRNKVAVPLITKLADAVDVMTSLETWSEGRSELGDAADLIAGNCFAARGELRRVQESLEKLVDSAEVHDLVVYCDRVRTRIRRAVEAVLFVVDTDFAHRPLVAQQAEIELSNAIVVRMSYAEIRRTVASCNPEDAAALSRTLGIVHTQLNRLVGDSATAVVRLADLVMLRKLDERVAEWLKAGGPESDGRRLFSDVDTTADLLRSINQRHELVQHDRAVVSRALAVMRGGGGMNQLSVLLQELRGLRGRDDDLDELLDQAAADVQPLGLVSALRQALERVESELHRPSF